MKAKRNAVAAVPSIDETTVVTLRKEVRTVLSALPKGRGLSKVALSTVITRDRGIAHTTGELDAAVEWNHERNFVDFVTNDYEVDEWHLTPKGAAR